MTKKAAENVPRGDVISISAPTTILEIVAGKLSAAGWAWGYCSAVTRHGWRWIVDAHKGDGRRYIVESDELLSAFFELGPALL